MSDRPLILHIDDEPNDLRVWQDAVNAVGTVRLEVRHPTDVSTEDLAAARVVLVDVRLDTWQERDELKALSLKPANGLALLAVLQEHAYSASKDTARAFALYTAVVKEIARGLIPRHHIIARAHNLEWVFDKTDTSDSRVARVVELAIAVRALPSPWPGESLASAGKALRDWLALPNAVTWADSAWRSVLGCRPPLHEFAEHTHGIGVLRWMLHRILPYPCFLLDDAHMAARLRVQTASLRQALQGPLQDVFQPALYGGQLSGFLGRRWWRSAIDAIVFDLAKDDPADLSLLHKRLRDRAPALETFDGPQAFAVLDADYQIKDELAGADDVVEIVPDDWPPFADSAWALRSDVDSNPDLKAIVGASPGDDNVA
jgi:hypothetical protein